MKACKDIKEYYKLFEDESIINYPSFVLHVQETSKKATSRKSAEEIERYHERRRKDLQIQIEKLIEEDEESKMRFTNIL